MVTDNKDNEKLSVEFGDYWVYISNLSFHFSGEYCISKNGKYILAWGENLRVPAGDEKIGESDDEIDQDDEQLEEGDEELYSKYLEHEFKEGFMLLEDQKLILKVFLPRPSHGKVANNGTFILNDNIDRSNELKGRFVACNKKGEELVSHKFSANLNSNGLSNDGRYAICQTAHSNTTDGNTATCFDLVTGKLLWQKIPETKNADAFEINVEENIIYFLHDNMGKFRYTLAGEFLDEVKWHQARIKYGTGYELIEIANQKLAVTGNPINYNVVEEVLNLYLSAIEKIDSDYFLAQVHRKVGEIYELMDKSDKAIAHYEKAQKLNPKVGVIKKLQRLKNETPKREKRLPFSVKLFNKGSIQLLETGKSSQAGVAPRGVYFQKDHYDDACWYIKNNYISGIEKGNAKISITDKRGKLINSVELGHLVFKTKRAYDSNHFIAISYDLNFYFYSPSLNLISSKKILKGIDNRYEVKVVDVSPAGDFVVVAVGNELFFCDQELKIIKEIAIPIETETQSYESDYFVIELESEIHEDISAIQINNSDDMYFGTYLGRVFKFAKDGSQELIYECKTPVVDIKRKGKYLFVACSEFIDIVENGRKINRIKDVGRIIWGDNAGFSVTKGNVKLFALSGSQIAELAFTDSVADVYLSSNELIVFTSKKSFVFSYST